MKKRKLPSLVTILVLTLITVVMWVGFSIYQALNQKAPPSVPADVAVSLNPSLDTTTIGKVETALYFSQSEVPNLTLGTLAPTATKTPLVLPTSTPIASSSATPVASPAASPTP